MFNRIFRVKGINDLFKFDRKHFSSNNHLSVVENESFFLYRPLSKNSKLMITCEHGSNVFPTPWKEIPPLMTTHWAYDIGSHDVGSSLSRKLDAPYISTKFSRLIIDANRSLDSPTLIRSKADGIDIDMNIGVNSIDLQERINRLWLPYRQNFKSTLMEYPNVELVLSVHSFTPVYEGQKRECEVGVLCIDEGNTLASKVCKNRRHLFFF